MTTQKQRSRKAANEECAEDIVAKVDDADGETLLAPAIAASLGPQVDPAAASCALVDGSTLALMPVVADKSAMRFKGPPPSAAPPAGHRQVGSFRFRSKWGR